MGLLFRAIDRVHTVDEAIRKVAGGALKPGVCKERAAALNNILQKYEIWLQVASIKKLRWAEWHLLCWKLLEARHELTSRNIFVLRR